ncbi:hypothetical protein [Acetobacter okinawensis]|uniref:hypothetical protein n=1 Tax=Acetobacter okinawensis TaxID=1076594 RepID=UPI00046FB262|nr:hypothetical protein [Acetobacter okinawensis]
MSRPPTEPGVADASTFFAGSGQTAALRPLQQEATAPDKMDDVHCLATLLEAAHAPRAPTALVQARALVAEYGTLSAVLLAVAQGEGSVRHLPKGCVCCCSLCGRVRTACTAPACSAATCLPSGQP